MYYGEAFRYSISLGIKVFMAYIKATYNLNPEREHKSGRISYFLPRGKGPKIINREPGKLLVSPMCGSRLQGEFMRRFQMQVRKYPVWEAA